MRILPLLVIFTFLPHLAHSAPKKTPTSIRCQCTTDKSGVPCHNGWCEVRNNATHISACALVKSHHSSRQHFACVRVSERSDEGYCSYDAKRNVTKCWCTGGDYCNVDLVDRIRDKRVSEEYEDFTVETNTEFNENSIDDNEKFPMEPRVQLQEREDVVDMRKPVEPKKLSPEEAALPPWRRMNPINTDIEYKPPPPPPMPGKHPILPPTTTTTTTTTAPPTTTTTSYEERMRQYEERRRQIELEREIEKRRRAELERQRLEERRHLESQHDTKRRFGEDSRSWPVPDAVPALIPTTTTAKTTSTSTTTTTTTSLPPTTTTTSTTITTTRPTTTTSSRKLPITEGKEETKNYESYYRNWKPHRRPFDLNPTQISINNFSAIVYPPKNFVKATRTSSTSTTTARVSSTTTTTTQATTTSTEPIIYPPANFKKASKPSTSTTTTIAPTEDVYTLPMTDDEDEEDISEPNRQMVEMPRAESDELEDVVMYTPKPPASRPLPTPSVRTPAEKMDEYKKLVEAAPSSSSIILPSFISLIILFLL